MRLSTDQVLQKAPFNLTNDQERENFKALLARMGVTTDKFLWGEVYKGNDFTDQENQAPYTDDEIAEAVDCFPAVFEKIFGNKQPNTSSKKQYNFTFGAPLSGKSTLFRRRFGDSSSTVLLDIEQGILPNMETYQELVAEKFIEATGTEHEKLMQAEEYAYKWNRDIVNYLFVLLLAWAIYKGYDIAACGVNTDKRVYESILPEVARQGYEIHSTGLFAAAWGRQAAGKHRLEVDQYFQSLPAEEQGRGKASFLAIGPLMDVVDTMEILFNKGEYWLSKTPEESEKHLFRVATFDKRRDQGLVGAPEGASVLPLMLEEIDREIPEEAIRSGIKAKLMASFRSSKGLSDYFPSFTLQNVMLAAVVVGAVTVVASSCFNKPPKLRV